MTEYRNVSHPVRFNGHFPGKPGLADYIGAKDDGGGSDNWSYRTCKAPVKSSPTTNQHPVFLQAGRPSCHPTNTVKALKGNVSVSRNLNSINIYH